MNAQTLKYRLAVGAALWLACATVTMAQVKTQTSQQKAKVTKEVTVERAEVVYVAGNDLVVKMESGEIRHFTVPDSARATVDGREITIRDLKPGMKLERTITTTSTEKTVKTIKSGTGTVVNVMPPNSVILRFEDGSVQQFKIPKNQKFTIDGQEKTAFDLREGMKITATRVTEEPVVEVTTSRQVSGSAPAAPPVVPLQGALLIAETTPPAPLPEPTAAPAPEPSAAPAAAPATAPAAKKLPKTGSVVPLIGLLGLLCSGASFGMRMLRRS
jgi:hypothetical protein